MSESSFDWFDTELGDFCDEVDDDDEDDDEWEFPISSTEVEFAISILGSFEGGVKKLVIFIDFFVGDLYN